MEQLEHPQITAIERTGYPITQHIKPTFIGLVEVVEYEKEEPEEA